MVVNMNQLVVYLQLYRRFTARYIEYILYVYCCQTNYEKLEF